jgi:hypothetical protein
MLSRSICLTAVMLGLSGCAGMSQQACLVSDWRTVGFEDGAAGLSVATIGRYRQACTEHGVSPDLETYRAGHAEGVEIYCRPAQGFEAGRRGAAYQGVCPANLEEEFLPAYNSGRQLFELEAAVRNVDARVASNTRTQEQITKELTEIGVKVASSETSTEDRVKLVARVAELGTKRGQLTAENEKLREQRALHQRDLDEYRQTLAFGF